MSVCLYHVQILSEVDTILFSLLILCGLTDSQGRVWRCHPGQLYAVELTIPEGQVLHILNRTVATLLGTYAYGYVATSGQQWWFTILCSYMFFFDCFCRCPFLKSVRPLL